MLLNFLLFYFFLSKVLPDLLRELDAMDSRQRLTSLIEGVLAANIFDWGSRACVELYQDGTILDIYKRARKTVSKRPWRVDEFDRLASAWFASDRRSEMGTNNGHHHRHHPHTGQGNLDGAEEESEGGSTGGGYRSRAHSAQEGVLVTSRVGGGSGSDHPASLPTKHRRSPTSPSRNSIREGEPEYGCRSNELSSSHSIHETTTLSSSVPIMEDDGVGWRDVRFFYRRALLFVDNSGADIVLGMLPLARELLRRGCEVVLVANSLPAINDVIVTELEKLVEECALLCPLLAEARQEAMWARAGCSGQVPPPLTVEDWSDLNSNSVHNGVNPNVMRVPPLYVVGSGQGGPCLDLRRVSRDLADASQGADLIVIEGMGRAIHTNLRTSFRCDCLKLAMVKNERLAKRLFGGQLYDCACIFEPRVVPRGDLVPRGVGGEGMSIRAANGASGGHHRRARSIPSV